jgi:hypothetical protein
MRDNVLVKDIYIYILYNIYIYIYIYCIKKNILNRILTLEVDFEGLGNLQGFFLNESHTMTLLLST